VKRVTRAHFVSALLLKDATATTPKKTLLEVKAMRRLGTSIAVIALASASTVAFAQGGFKAISEVLTGYEETPSSVSTTGNGTFTARISNDESRIDWQLSYSDLEGSVQQAHIHFGQKAVTGPISVFLCTNLGNGPTGTQPCPAPPATISGTIVAADVTNLAAERGISTGELDELILAIRAGATYVNVHSTTWPGGEIRSQIDGNSGR
jgi:CHRD domain-containing protein